ncbi:OpgC domain-containing protein [Teichococcus aestuarii]|uniref:OpgC domain-containing protein n=1 Tax=Teichococcus aestuarii TaxID=568898 RepID=UPI003612BDA3
MTTRTLQRQRPRPISIARPPRATARHGLRRAGQEQQEMFHGGRSAQPVGVARHSASARTRHRTGCLARPALITIFINHVSGNILENVTHKNFGFSDAADLFVMFAGYAAAAAYFSRYAIGQRLAVSLKVASRAVRLYTTHLALVVLGARCSRSASSARAISACSPSSRWSR